MAVKWRIVDDQRGGRMRAGAFYERLTRIPPKVKKRINAANEKSAEDLAAMMRRLVPTDERDLERSIVYYEVTGALSGGIVWRVAAGDETAYYARFVEFGNGFRDATPFFYPSYRALRRLIKARQLRAFRQAMKDSKTP